MIQIYSSDNNFNDGHTYKQATFILQMYQRLSEHTNKIDQFKIYRISYSTVYFFFEEGLTPKHIELSFIRLAETLFYISV